MGLAGAEDELGVVGVTGTLEDVKQVDPDGDVEKVAVADVIEWGNSWINVQKA